MQQQKKIKKNKPYKFKDLSFIAAYFKHQQIDRSWWSFADFTQILAILIPKFHLHAKITNINHFNQAI